MKIRGFGYGGSRQIAGHEPFAYAHPLGNSDGYQNKGLASWAIRMVIKTKILRARQFVWLSLYRVRQKIKNAAEAAVRGTSTPFPISYSTRVGAAGQEDIDGVVCVPPLRGWASFAGADPGLAAWVN